LISLSIFCCIRTIRGTRNRILNDLLLLLLVVDISFALSSTYASHALFAHSNAISVLPVPVLYIIEPLQPLEIHASTASIWSFVSLNGNFSKDIAEIVVVVVDGSDDDADFGDDDGDAAVPGPEFSILYCPTTK